MSTYELDDEKVRCAVENGLIDHATATGQILASLREQLPIPVPTKIGAVVRTTTGIAVLADPRPGASGVWSLWDADGLVGWRDVGDAKFGRITEVLSEGVNL